MVAAESLYCPTSAPPLFAKLANACVHPLHKGSHVEVVATSLAQLFALGIEDYIVGLCVGTKLLQSDVGVNLAEGFEHLAIL